MPSRLLLLRPTNTTASPRSNSSRLSPANNSSVSSDSLPTTSNHPSRPRVSNCRSGNSISSSLPTNSHNSSRTSRYRTINSLRRQSNLSQMQRLPGKIRCRLLVGSSTTGRQWHGRSSRQTRVGGRHTSRRREDSSRHTLATTTGRPAA